MPLISAQSFLQSNSMLMKALHSNDTSVREIAHKLHTLSAFIEDPYSEDYGWGLKDAKIWAHDDVENLKACFTNLSDFTINKLYAAETAAVLIWMARHCAVLVQEEYSRFYSGKRTYDLFLLLLSTLDGLLDGLCVLLEKAGSEEQCFAVSVNLLPLVKLSIGPALRFVTVDVVCATLQPKSGTRTKVSDFCHQITSVGLAENLEKAFEAFKEVRSSSQLAYNWKKTLTIRHYLAETDERRASLIQSCKTRFSNDFKQMLGMHKIMPSVEIEKQAISIFQATLIVFKHCRDMTHFAFNRHESRLMQLDAARYNEMVHMITVNQASWEKAQSA